MCDKCDMGGPDNLQEWQRQNMTNIQEVQAQNEGQPRTGVQGTLPILSRQYSIPMLKHVHSGTDVTLTTPLRGPGNELNSSSSNATTPAFVDAFPWIASNGIRVRIPMDIFRQGLRTSALYEASDSVLIL